MLGSIIGERYLLSERLGAGGMGEVFKAQDVRLQRPAAVKLLRAHLVTDLDALARFGREASNAARINDPHVVQVYDYGDTEQRQPFIAMELVPGESLGALLKREGRLTPSRASTIVAQVAAGLEAAHRLGIVHRDLKPDNVLLTPMPDGSERAKVSDFGISKAFADEGQQITQSGIVTGTCEYMSPEQVLGHALDHRSDVYALGLVAFRMLTGDMPFACGTVEESMMARLSQSPRTLDEVAPEIRWPRGLQAVFDRVLAKDAEHRHSTARSFAADLATAIEAPPRTTTTAARERRRSLSLSAAAAVTLAVAAGAIWYGRPWSRAGAVERDTVETGRADEPPGDPSTRIVLAPTPRREPPVAAQPELRDTLVEPPRATSAPERRPAERRPVESKPRPTRDSSASVPAVLPVPGVDARERLGRLRQALHPDLPADSVTLVLNELGGLVPLLQTSHDSVDAAILQAEAYGKLERYEDACAILDGARRSASPRQREKIRLWSDRGLCTFPGWAES